MKSDEFEYLSLEAAGTDLAEPLQNGLFAGSPE